MSHTKVEPRVSKEQEFTHALPSGVTRPVVGACRCFDMRRLVPGGPLSSVCLTPVDPEQNDGLLQSSQRHVSGFGTPLIPRLCAGLTPGRGFFHSWLGRNTATLPFNMALRVRFVIKDNLPGLSPSPLTAECKACSCEYKPVMGPRRGHSSFTLLCTSICLSSLRLGISDLHLNLYLRSDTR